MRYLLFHRKNRVYVFLCLSSVLYIFIYKHLWCDTAEKCKLKCSRIALLLENPKKNKTEPKWRANWKCEISFSISESEKDGEKRWANARKSLKHRCLCFHVTRLRITFNLSYFTYSLAGLWFWISVFKQGNKLFIHLHFRLTEMRAVAWDGKVAAVSAVDYSTCQCQCLRRHRRRDKIGN